MAESVSDQLGLFEARAARDDGIQRAADHADAVQPRWTDVAFAYFCAYARHHAEFITESARKYAEDSGLPAPPDKRAWGHVATRACRAGVVRAGGFAKAVDPKVHCNVKTLWVSRRAA